MEKNATKLNGNTSKTKTSSTFFLAMSLANMVMHSNIHQPVAVTVSSHIPKAGLYEELDVEQTE